MSHIDIVTPEPLAHPSLLLANAHLFGLSTPSVEGLKILEFDCGDGGNLLSIAASLPDSSCLGISESSAAIEQGKSIAEKAGLTNVELKEGDTSAIPKKAVYDIILLKSVFSLTAPGEQAALLTKAASHLGENGIILVEHICLPGWSFKEPLRQQVQYHTRNEEDPAQKVLKGRQYLHALAGSVPDQLALYQALARSEREISSQIPDANFATEYLSDSITPSYFHEFAEKLAEAGLQYVAEASLDSMLINRFPQMIGTIMPEDSSLVDTEQYIDFVTNRSRRFSIVCPDSETIERSIEPDIVKDLRFSMNSTPVDPATVLSESETQLNGPGGSIVTLKTKASKTALLLLSEKSPARLSFDEITTEVTARAGDLDDEDFLSIAESLSAGAVSGIVRIDTDQGNWLNTLSETPQAASLVRAQAAATMPYVSSLQHRPVEIDSISSTLLQMLDGTATHADLTTRLGELITNGEVTATSADGETISDEASIDAIAKQQIDQLLARFAANGLLVG